MTRPWLLLPLLYLHHLGLGLTTAGPALGAARLAAAPQPPLLPIEAALRAGRYAEAAEQAARLSQTLRGKQLARAEALRGRALLAQGKIPEARAQLEAAVGRDPAAWEPLHQLGLVYRAAGQRDAERAVWGRFFDAHDAGTLDQKDPVALRLLGVAARYLGSYQDAGDTLRDAADLARQRHLLPELVETDIEWAALFLEKYAAGDAEQCLDEALAQDPDAPDARALLARVKQEQGNDISAAEKELDRALRINPRHSGALGARVEILIDGEQFAEAEQVARKMLNTNPNDPVAQTLIAATYLLRDRIPDWQREKLGVLSALPRYTELHRTVAEMLTTQHRYDEAVALLEEAVALDPKDYYALSALGSGYLRLGQDDRGLEMLRRAWRGDHFNVRTFNLLELFEKVIPKKYDLVTIDLDPGKRGSGGLRVRLPSAEKDLLLPVLVPFLQAEWAELVKRYRFTPKLPVTLELYADPQHYAVRTVGLPSLAALGVTFGQVVTGRSPAQGAFNWGLMIWHEMSHVFAIQMSRSRVPRWFTEGLSEWETAQHRPEWTRRTSAELYAALRDGKLPSLRELNSGFVRARDVAHIVVAYHEAAAAVDFLIRRYGFGPVLKALPLFGQGRPATEVIPQVTGANWDSLDRAFRQDLSERLVAYRGTFYVRPSDFSDFEALEAQHKEHPDDVRVSGLLALALAQGGALDKAKVLVQAALKKDPRSHEALLAQARVQIREKDWAGAERTLRALIAADGDGYDARFFLGYVLKEKGDVAGAEPELQRSKGLDPDRAEPYVELGKLYSQQQREGLALGELLGAVKLEIMDADLLRATVKRLYTAKRWADVVTVGEMARFVVPYAADLRQQVGEALLALGRRGEARAELSAALLALPGASDEEEAQQVKKQREEIQRILQRAGK